MQDLQKYQATKRSLFPRTLRKPLYLICALTMSMCEGKELSQKAVKLKIDKTQEARLVNWSQLLGANLGLWYKKERLEEESIISFFDKWKPAYIRIPGGSWTNEYYWNGHGVRQGQKFDHGKLKDGIWQVDFSGYAPGFRVHDSNGHLSDYHGSIDIRYLHEWIKARGASAIVGVNMGTGSPELAAEWVKWVRKNNYPVAYWEIGNELDGDWEVGHIQKDGKKMTGTLYAKKFLEYAKAMRAVDPTIKLGGPACSSAALPFMEELIKIAGREVDFLSFHTYPIEGKVTHQKKYKEATTVKKAIAQCRQWLNDYHPDRADAVKIGVTEWNLQVMESRPTVDIASALWSALFLTSLAESGVDFANHWDLFSTTKKGGHGLFSKNKAHPPRAVARLFESWQELLSAKLIPTQSPDPDVQVILTEDEKGKKKALLLNLSESEEKEVDLLALGYPAQATLEAKRFSRVEYFWDPHLLAPRWSEPFTDTVATLENGRLSLPPLSALALSSKTTEQTKQEAPEVASLEILLPEKAETQFPSKGFVIIRDQQKRPWTGKPIKLSFNSLAHLSLETFTTTQPVVEFELTHDQAGPLQIQASAGGHRAQAMVDLFTVKDRPVIVWENYGKQGDKDLKSDYPLVFDPAAIRNSGGFVADLNEAVSKPQENCLLQPKTFNFSGKKENVRGVIVKAKALPGLKSKDGKGHLQIILESDLEYWMVLGKIPLGDLFNAGENEAKAYLFPIKEKRYLEAMSQLKNVRIQLNTSSPVTGRIFIAELGFLMK